MTRGGDYWHIIPPGDTSSCSLKDLNILVRQVDGFGAPPLQHNVFDLPLQPGKQFQDYKILPRTIVLQAQMHGGTSLSALHELRSKLLTLVRPTSVPGTASYARLRYAISGSTIEIPVYYGGGMGGRIGRGLEETAALELIAYDPIWKKTTVTSCDLGVSQSGTFRYLAAKVDGLWTPMGANTVDSMTTGIRAIAVNNAQTELAICGDFTNFGGSAAGDGLVLYDLSNKTFSSASSGLNNGAYCATYSPNDTLVIGGTFSSAGGTSVCRIATWNGTTFGTYGTGFNNSVWSIGFSPCGVLYAAGVFDQASGSSACAIAYWDGSQWNNMDGGLRTAIAYGATIRPNGRVLVVGSFTIAGCSASVAANRIAEWNESNWSSLGEGLDDIGYAVLVSHAGTVYAVGEFLTAGSTSASRIAKWDGYAWHEVGNGVNDIGYSLDILDNTDLHVSGKFSEVGDGVSAADQVAVWNGYAWRRLDIDLPGSPDVYEITHDDDDLYLGFSTCGTGTYSASTLITNSGDTEAYPIIKVCGSGTLQSITNITTDEALLFDLDINTGETITIDLSASGKSIESDWRGNLLGQLIPLSDFATFHLEPGDNTLAVYVSSSGAECAACINFYERYLSTDGLF